MNHQEDIDELLAKYFANEALSASQQASLDHWIKANQTEFKRINALVNAPTLGEPTFDADEAWGKIEDRLRQPTRRMPLNGRRVLVWTIAATFALLIATTLFKLSLQEETASATYRNDQETTESILLSDGSEVTLYPNSRLEFREGKERRLAQLEGKAFFNVKKRRGKAFDIEAAALRIEVVGTSFLVNTNQEEKAGVFVKSGTVKVSVSKNELILNANEKVELEDGELRMGIIHNPKLFFGKKKKLAFENTPIKQVVKEIEKQTDIKIELGKGLDDNFITTRIDTEAYESIASELAFICGCRCDTITQGKHYRLYK